MSSSSFAGDRRPVPSVAIVGNDVVLAAAPATPVQLAHACLRRGFTVAVPASWGDELVAAEGLRRLASRDRGPAVMCVCPYVRSRLLATGPDLAPFLVSLISPPVATARYLRTLYGDHGVHITYIGGCPSGEDETIDARLTPNDFLADLADHGIALSEQPLVFDSIVPPDRRRWCSLPGGVPSAEVLGSETDARTLVEIERDDASTVLAQHIITYEHVLLDLAPSLGCACSGAVGPVPSRNARAAVTALEPPRALGPIIDAAAVVALDAPVGSPTLGAGAAMVAPPLLEVGVAEPSLDSVLDSVLGLASDADVKAIDAESDPATTVTIAESFMAGPAAVDHEAPALERARKDARSSSDEELPAPAAVGLVDLPADIAAVPDDVPPSVVTEDTSDTAPSDAFSVSGSSTAQEPASTESTVRRRTPPSVHTRYASATIPKATGADGRPLPRAYVAKRRTPPTGAAIIPDVARAAAGDTGAVAPTVTPAAAAEETPAAALDSTADVHAHTTTPIELSAQAPTTPAPTGDGETAAVESSPPSETATQPAGEPSPAPPTGAAGESSAEKPPPSGQPGAGAFAEPANQGALTFLLVTALVALGVFVLFSLRR
jgi:hypothetical protein